MFLNFSLKSENSESNDAWKHSNAGKVPLPVANTLETLTEADWNFIDVRVVDMNWKGVGVYRRGELLLMSNCQKIKLGNVDFGTFAVLN